MSNCIDTPECEHSVPTKFNCNQCSGNIGKLLFCFVCNTPLNKCECITAGIRKSNERITMLETSVCCLESFEKIMCSQPAPRVLNDKIEKILKTLEDTKTSNNVNCISIYKMNEKIEKLQQSREAHSRTNKEFSERLEKLEEDNKTRQDTIACMNQAYNKNQLDLERRIKQLESSKLSQELDPKVWVHVNDRLNELESKTMLLPGVEEYMKQWSWVHGQIDRINILIDNIVVSVKKPHRCPVCEGRGFVFLMISTTDINQEECKSCEGKGIVWA